MKKSESVIIRRGHFEKRPYFSRYQFLLDNYQEGKILDIGNIGGVYGEGISNSSYQKFRHTISPDSTLYGFDLFPPKNPDLYPNQKMGNLEDGLPYEDKYFDTVYLGEVLEHTMLPGYVLQEIHRILKDDGIFIMDVPNPYSFQRLIRFLLKRLEHFGDETHLIFFTPASLHALFTHVGFNISKMNTKMPSNFRYLPGWLFTGLGSHLLVAAKKS